MKIGKILLIAVFALLTLGFINTQSVSAEEGPEISGDVVYVTSVSEPTPIETIQTYLTAYDEYDGDLTEEIYVVEDGYTANNHILGTYDITFGVSDSSENETLLTVSVVVIDDIAPEISFPPADEIEQIERIGLDGFFNRVSYVYVNKSDEVTFEEVDTYLRDLMTISDNYDSFEDLTITVDHTFTMEYVNRTGYGGDITYIVEDTSGNISEYHLTQILVDDIPPEINGVDHYTKTYNDDLLDINYIKSNLEITDDDPYQRTGMDPNPTNMILFVESDNYSENYNIVGEYEIVFTAHDASGNDTYFTVIIEVIDLDFPFFSYGEHFISVSEFVSMSHQDLISLLSSMGAIENSESLSFTQDDYTGNENVPGTYTMALNTGTETLDLTINVMGEGSDEEEVGEDIEEEIEEEKIGFFRSVRNFFTNGFNFLGDIFSKIGNFFQTSFSFITWMLGNKE